jgi:hypothetical protein
MHRRWMREPRQVARSVLVSRRRYGQQVYLERIVRFILVLLILVIGQVASAARKIAPRRRSPTGSAGRTEEVSYLFVVAQHIVLGCAMLTRGASFCPSLCHILLAGVYLFVAAQLFLL